MMFPVSSDGVAMAEEDEDPIQEEGARSPTPLQSKARGVRNAAGVAGTCQEGPRGQGPVEGDAFRG